jgi:hypothetical protein
VKEEGDTEEEYHETTLRPAPPRPHRHSLLHVRLHHDPKLLPSHKMRFAFSFSKLRLSLLPYCTTDLPRPTSRLPAVPVMTVGTARLMEECTTSRTPWSGLILSAGDTSKKVRACLLVVALLLLISCVFVVFFHYHAARDPPAPHHPVFDIYSLVLISDL